MIYKWSTKRNAVADFALSYYYLAYLAVKKYDKG